MSKLGCPCGNIISDSLQNDMEQNWGSVIKYKEWFDYQEEVTQVLSGLFNAYKDGEHVEWLEKNCPVYSDQPLDAIISDIMSRLDQDVGLVYAKCNKCGSFLVQNSHGENKYRRYIPDNT